MTIAILMAVGLSLATWTALASRRRWYRGESNLGLMSQQWIAEQRSDESQHRLTGASSEPLSRRST